VDVATNPFDMNQVTKAPFGQMERITYSQVSAMPQGMMGGMNRDELMDSIAYLISGGDPSHRVFQ